MVFDARLVALLMVAVVAIMLLPTVRKFYTPPMMDTPPMRVWVRYIFNIPMDVADSFKFRYPEKNESEEKLNE